MLLPLDRTRRIGIASFVTFIFLSGLLYAGLRIRLLHSSKLSFSDSRLQPFLPYWDPFRFGQNHVPNTTVVAHVSGFTVLRNVYLRNGTFFFVHPDLPPSGVRDWYPLVKDMISKPVDLGPDVDTDPGDQELTLLGASDANEVLGSFAQEMPGVTVMVYDTVQFLRHYYHWWGEVILGAWRVYSSSSTFYPPSWTGTSYPSRFVIPFSKNGAWRDHAGVNAPLMRAAFPNAAIEESDWWSDLRQLNTTVAFPTLILVNRQAAHRHPNGGKWYKMISGAMDVKPNDRFWESIRNSVIRGLLGYIPRSNERGAVVGSDDTGSWRNFVPLVTYISRQGGGRRLTDKDHEGLVAALENLEKEGVIRFFHARMEKLSVPEQIELAARTTVMIGVHGNGLTHQLWMPPSRWSTVMEIFLPNGYIFDYEMLARNVGHRHYAVWNDTFVTYPKGVYHQNFSSPEGFHGNDIPVFGPAVAAKIKERLAE